ncbi:hypothetical protein [Streptomyces tanashiensis]
MTIRATRFAVSLEEVSPSSDEVTALDGVSWGFRKARRLLHRRKSPRIT